jgi:biopolymer transport protein ExbB
MQEKHPFCGPFPGFLHDACDHAIGGGMWMIPIAIVFFSALVVTIERVITIWFRSSVNKEGFVAQLTTMIVSGNLQGAIKFVTGQPSTPLGNVVKAGLMKVNKSDAEVQSALDEATLRELPKLEKRTGFLAMFGNVSMLFGLLGTISGLIKCFASVGKEGVDPQLKSQILADGISEAMNCTAFGLISAIPCLLAFSIINGKTQHLIDDINETAVSVLNLVVSNRDKLKV